MQNDGPDKISYEQRKLGNNRYEAIPRRRSDKRLFSQLSEKQISAYQRIDQAYGYEMTGLPCARMRYTDAPPGFDWELTPSQIETISDYREWRTKVYLEAPAALYAIIRYMTGSNLTQIERSLRIHTGKASRYISHGLDIYCELKEWGTKPARRLVQITGFHAEITQFFKNETDDLGRSVWNAKIKD